MAKRTSTAPTPPDLDSDDTLAATAVIAANGFAPTMGRAELKTLHDQAIAEMRRADAAIDEIELMGVLMDRDWLGMRLLYALREEARPLPATDLADAAKLPVDACAAALARLYLHGALELADDCFVFTEYARTILQGIEAIAQDPAPVTSQ